MKVLFTFFRVATVIFLKRFDKYFMAHNSENISFFQCVYFRQNACANFPRFASSNRTLELLHKNFLKLFADLP